MPADPSILTGLSSSSPSTSLPSAPKPTVPAFRHFGDAATTRGMIFDNVMAAAQKLEPVSNTRHSLHIENPRWTGPADYTIAQQKQAVLSRGTLGRRLTGDIVLRDTTGNEVARRSAQLARVPYMTDRGTFIIGGNEYTMANQMRLRPGIFTRVKQNGELESHVNVAKGFSHRLFFDPASQVFRINMGQANIPLAPILRSLGVTDRQLREAWGDEIAASNMQHSDPQAITKLYHKLFRNGTAPMAEQPLAIANAFHEMTLDPEVTKRTLNKPYANVTPEVMLDTTRKLLAVNRGEAEPDDRDALAFQHMMGPEDLFAERLAKAKSITRQLLWRASAKGNLNSLTTNPYEDSIRGALIGSGLGMPSEEINPAEIFDQQSRVTRMGEGGIPSLDAVPDEARSVQPSQFGFVDFLRTPESGKVGVDARLARAAVKGRDGAVYTPVRNVKTGQIEYKTPQELADAVLAFPGEMPKPGDKTKTHAVVLEGGKVRPRPVSSVQYEIPQMEDTFSPLGNMVPMKSMVKGQRAVMAARMITQALPIRNGEAPYVQSGVPGQEGQSFEDLYGKHMGAVHAESPARVVAVDNDTITLQGQDGQTKTVQLYNNFPYNRKTFIHQTPMVKAGDTVQPGQLLARSNFTDDKGTTALGLNARVAYVPWGGLNFEDANLVSESFAKRASSEHMYQHQHEWEDRDHQGRNAYVSVFPSTYNKQVLNNFDDDGVVKPGTVVKHGDPLILVSREKERNKKSLIAGNKPSFQDVSQTWDHEHDGVVTDVVKTPKGVSVVVKSHMPMQVGDKLSGRYGDKGIVAHIIPDEEMPTDAKGNPFEILLNPLGIISRTNPAQIVEGALGKVAAQTGQPYKVPDFQGQDDMVEYALNELRKHGVSDTEDIIDPRTGRKIPGIFTGNRWFMKLHHTSESKAQGRGLGAYTAEQAPAKGGPEGAKRIGMLETNALLSHGATEFVRNSGLIRGQSNPRLWAQYMSGFTPPVTDVPHVYHKFVNNLKAAGLNVVRQGTRTHIMALTDKDIDQLAGNRALRNVETVDWRNMDPIPGGLFDKELTGGHATPDGGGNRWAHIPLHEPMPSPAMEEPIRRVLGLTTKKFNGIIGGTEHLNGRTGPAAIGAALNSINLPQALAQAREDVASGKKTVRDNAIRRLAYLKSADRLGIHPRDWMLSKVPVLPPAFRPVSTMGAKKLPLVADPNYLYKELWDNNENLKQLAGQLDDADLGDERLAVYNAFKAVTGLGDPTHPKNQERQVKGILKHVFGSSPKLGTVQRRLLGSTTDLVGRAVIAPDPDLDMDQVGIPENQAWTIYRPILINRLVRRGMPRVQAARAVEERSPAARQTLLKEMESGVVVINRAPTLHRYGMMGARPTLVRGNVLKVPPLVVGGFGADFDGDAMQYHVPVTESERQEILDKMLPSRNLLSAASFGVHYLPSQEYIGGLYESSARTDTGKPPMTFATTADAIRAYREGKIGVGRRVEILNR